MTVSEVALALPGLAACDHDGGSLLRDLYRPALRFCLRGL
jgi:hypothetical protein